MDECPFCSKANIETYLIKEFNSAYAIFSRNPISDAGHFLVIPRKHHQNFSSLNYRELFDFLALAVWLYIKINSFHPGAKNILVNEGKVAGQSVGHPHLHFICRETDDGITNMHKDAEKPTISIERVSEFRSRFT